MVCITNPTILNNTGWTHPPSPRGRKKKKNVDEHFRS
uniref:Uncharacterized protein n=1 Tax=Myoviridae sp. ct0Qb19 TaxID=2827653 RepID=A0A8S5SZ70_9CAUD|nr:MAG TPA: hypothetical protein [Myoviridae sp. ct0Qb19]